MKALSIRQPHAEAIMRGAKLVEFRSQPTSVRGRIYIYASKSRYSTTEEVEMLERYGIDDIAGDDLPRGVLVGTVDHWNCTGAGGNYSWHVRNLERAEKLLKPTRQPQPIWFNPF